MYIQRYPESIELKNSKGETALLIAAKLGNVNFIETLMKHGADINTQDQDGCSGLHHAAAWGHLDTLDFLIANGCQFNTPNLKGWTPMDYAFSGEVEERLRECALDAVEKQKTLKRRSRLVRSSTLDAILHEE